jgi:MFS transporter, BCD family, chlorophyll transporter
VLRDFVSGLATQGWLGSALNTPVTGYAFVYHLEMLLLFVALAALGPLVRRRSRRPVLTATSEEPRRFGLAGLPG